MSNKSNAQSEVNRVKSNLEFCIRNMEYPETGVMFPVTGKHGITSTTLHSEANAVILLGRRDLADKLRAVAGDPSVDSPLPDDAAALAALKEVLSAL